MCSLKGFKLITKRLYFPKLFSDFFIATKTFLRFDLKYLKDFIVMKCTICTKVSGVRTVFSLSGNLVVPRPTQVAFSQLVIDINLPNSVRLSLIQFSNGFVLPPMSISDDQKLTGILVLCYRQELIEAFKKLTSSLK